MTKQSLIKLKKVTCVGNKYGVMGNVCCCVGAGVVVVVVVVVVNDDDDDNNKALLLLFCEATFVETKNAC